MSTKLLCPLQVTRYFPTLFTNIKRRKKKKYFSSEDALDFNNPILSAYAIIIPLFVQHIHFI